MHLRRIELHGFKTFASRAVVELQPGVSAVVGPNGSGKSNIADAVRWALGETNLRQVRCRGTEELIFAGSGRRASLGMAEVSLVFANEGGWLDLPFSEVRVSRRAYRSGENEYLLNGTRVRLRDIVDLLSGASIHAGGHVVIGQGMVDAVLSQRPEERRLLVENLAGLKQYYLRRDDAEARLAATESNLVHVDVLIAELAPQVASLAAQAEVLRSYRAAEDELRALLRASFSIQAAQLRQRQQDADRARNEASAALAAAKAEISRIQEEGEALTAAYNRGRADLGELQRRLQEASGALATVQRDAAVAGERLVAAEERQHRATAERALLAARAEQARAGAEAAEAERATLRTACLHAEAQVAASRRTRQHALQARDGALAAHRKAEHAAAEADRRVALHTHEIAVLATRLDAAAAELRQQEGQIGPADQALATAERSLAQARISLDAAQQALAATRAEEADARASEDTARRHEAARGQELRTARDRLREAETRFALLQELQEQHDGYSEPAQALATHPAARGLVADLLHVPPAYQAALALALGPLLEAVVTGEPASLLREYAQRRQEGQLRLVLLAGDDERDAEGHTDRSQAVAARRWLHAEGLLSHEETIGWAADLVDATFPALSRALHIDRLLVVRDAAAVLRCRVALRHTPLSLVAAAGTLVLHQDGSLSRGMPVRLAALLRRRAELEELQAHGNELRDAVTRALAEHERALQETLRTERRLHDARERLGRSDNAVARARDEGRFQERVVAQARDACTRTQGQLARLRDEVALHARRREDQMQHLAEAQDHRRMAQQQVAEARTALAAAESAASGATGRLREAERETADMRARLDAAEQVTRERARALIAAEQDRARHTADSEQAGAEAASLHTTLEALRARETAASAAVAALEQGMEPVAGQLDALAARQSSMRQAAAAAAAAGEKAERSHERAHRAADAARHQLDLLRAQATAEIGCALEDLPAATLPANAAGRIRTLREQLASFGLINARAEEDHSALLERLTFVQTQAEDLRAGVARLRAIIADANATVRDRFGATVDDLQRHFAGYFERLFGGGSCRLSATYDPQGLPSGMGIEAQPPARRTRDLALLSGGERALVALALLFAMLKVRPVPFCLLDEVEAALDEANTGRFGAILRELATDTQFVVITHNRGTMLHADRLYGITMSETGVSSLFGINLHRDEGGQIVLNRSGA